MIKEVETLTVYDKINRTKKEYDYKSSVLEDNIENARRNYESIKNKYNSLKSQLNSLKNNDYYQRYLKLKQNKFYKENGIIVLFLVWSVFITFWVLFLFIEDFYTLLHGFILIALFVLSIVLTRSWKKYQRFAIKMEQLNNFPIIESVFKEAEEKIKIEEKEYTENKEKLEVFKSKIDEIDLKLNIEESLASLYNMLVLDSSKEHFINSIQFATSLQDIINICNAERQLDILEQQRLNQQQANNVMIDLQAQQNREAQAYHNQSAALQKQNIQAQNRQADALEELTRKFK